MTRLPADVVLEPEERVLIATKPLAFWFPAAVVLLALWAAALLLVVGTVGAAWLIGLIALAATVFLGVRWIDWRARWTVLTDRRIIARWGVFTRNQAAILLSRVQDVTLQRPFPLSHISGYGVLQVETAGEYSSERLSAGVHRIAMEHADEFHRLLTDALTPED